MTRAALTLLLLLAVPIVWASGPDSPKGWEGSIEPTLPNGQSCCLPADLNGAGLIGGAFVLISTNKKEFGVFALTYTPPDKERWQLLEKHPISRLDEYVVSVEKPGQFPNAHIKVCVKTGGCVSYYTAAASQRLKKAEVKIGH